jgi:hypothetical protein
MNAPSGFYAGTMAVGDVFTDPKANIRYRVGVGGKLTEVGRTSVGSLAGEVIGNYTMAGSDVEVRRTPSGEIINVMKTKAGGEIGLGAISGSYSPRPVEEIIPIGPTSKLPSQVGPGEQPPNPPQITIWTVKNLVTGETYETQDYGVVLKKTVFPTFDLQLSETLKAYPFFHLNRTESVGLEKVYQRTGTTKLGGGTGPLPEKFQVLPNTGITTPTFDVSTQRASDIVNRKIVGDEVIGTTRSGQTVVLPPNIEEFKVVNPNLESIRQSNPLKGIWGVGEAYENVAFGVETLKTKPLPTLIGIGGQIFLVGVALPAISEAAFGSAIVGSGSAIVGSSGIAGRAILPSAYLGYSVAAPGVSHGITTGDWVKGTSMIAGSAIVVGGTYQIGKWVTEAASTRYLQSEIPEKLGQRTTKTFGEVKYQEEPVGGQYIGKSELVTVTKLKMFGKEYRADYDFDAPIVYAKPLKGGMLVTAAGEGKLTTYAPGTFATGKGVTGLPEYRISTAENYLVGQGSAVVISTSVMPISRVQFVASKSYSQVWNARTATLGEKTAPTYRLGIGFEKTEGGAVTVQFQENVIASIEQGKVTNLVYRIGGKSDYLSVSNQGPRTNFPSSTDYFTRFQISPKPKTHISKPFEVIGDFGKVEPKPTFGKELVKGTPSSSISGISSGEQTTIFTGSSGQVQVQALKKFAPSLSASPALKAAPLDAVGSTQTLTATTKMFSGAYGTGAGTLSAASQLNRPIIALQTELVSKTALSEKSTSITKFTPRMVELLVQPEKTVVIQPPEEKVEPPFVVPPILIPKTITKPIEKTEQPFIPEIIYPPTEPFTPPKEVPFIPPIPSGPLFFSWPMYKSEKKRKKTKVKREFKYAPSVTAFVFNIHGKQPRGVMTGASIRPLPPLRNRVFASFKMKKPKIKRLKL